MNMLTRLAEKQAAVRSQLKDEVDWIERGYNRITESFPAITEPEMTAEPKIQLEDGI
ncbi:hypothetical protein [Filimonas effusa]|uniref:hypothetical protein n=1 Tax=Filimonas effusa TaxID=2508721 RepID=UPI0013E98E3C|nr:hypothetical protein [Filimonas effusa]